MALSNVSYIGDGLNQTFSITFPYLSTSHVKIFVDGVEDVTFTWLSASSIQTTGIPGSGLLILIKRVTPTTPLVDFVDGSTLTESLLDTATLQTLYVSEETKDVADGAMNLDTVDNKYQANSKVIKNVATPVNGNDAVNKTYVDSTIPASVASASASASTATTQAGIATAQAVIATAKAGEALASAAAAAISEGNVSNKANLAGDTFTGLVNLAVGADIASASTVDLTAATGNTVNITGTTTVTAFTMNAGQQMILIAAGALPLAYHATTMNINGGADYTCAAGDRLYVTKDLAGVVRVNVTKQDGTAVAGSLTAASDAEYETGTDTAKFINAAVARTNNIVMGTPVATTSGTSIDLTGIPTWAKEVTLMLNDVSLNGADNVNIKLGTTSGFEATGYIGASVNFSSAVTTAIATTAFQFILSAAARSTRASLVFTKFSPSADTWILHGSANDGVANAQLVNGSKTLAGALSQIQLTGSAGGTFDNGSANITWK